MLPNLDPFHATASEPHTPSTQPHEQQRALAGNSLLLPDLLQGALCPAHSQVSKINK